MLIAARNGFMADGKRLPYDAEVEYLESTGTQYIDTGIYPKPTTNFSIDATCSAISTTQVFFGTRKTGSAQALYILFFSSNAGLKTRWAYGDGRSTESYIYVADGSRRIYSTTSTNVTTLKISGGFSISCNNSSLFSDHLNIYLFAGNFNGIATGDGLIGKIHSAKFYEGTTLVRDFIPVRFTNEQRVSEGAMYDRVSGELFRNQGTGAFVIGPDK